MYKWYIIAQSITYDSMDLKIFYMLSFHEGPLKIMNFSFKLEFNSIHDGQVIKAFLYFIKTLIEALLTSLVVLPYMATQIYYYNSKVTLAEALIVDKYFPDQFYLHYND